MKRRHYKFILPLAFLSLLGTFIGKGAGQASFEKAVVKKAIDGDTIELMSKESVRYIGIDCPETHRKTNEEWHDVSEVFGQEAVRFNEQLVAGKEVRLEFDVQKRDKYKRLLAYCFVKDNGREIFVQAEILRKGLAYLYTFPPNVKYVEDLVNALEEAKQERKGVWSQDLNINSKEASQYIGQRKRVLGKIKKSSVTAKTIRLVMDGLLVVIFKNDLELFEKKGIDPSDFYQGKEVEVFGLIKMYKGKPEIIVSNPWQIEIKNSD